MSYNANHYDVRADEDIVDVLTAISVVSRRLASNLTIARQQSKSREGGKSHEQDVYKRQIYTSSLSSVNA